MKKFGLIIIIITIIFTGYYFNGYIKKIKIEIEIKEQNEIKIQEEIKQLEIMHAMSQIEQLNSNLEKLNIIYVTTTQGYHIFILELFSITVDEPPHFGIETKDCLILLDSVLEASVYLYDIDTNELFDLQTSEKRKDFLYKDVETIIKEMFTEDNVNNIVYSCEEIDE